MLDRMIRKTGGLLLAGLMAACTTSSTEVAGRLALVTSAIHSAQELCRRRECVFSPVAKNLKLLLPPTHLTGAAASCHYLSSRRRFCARG